MTFPNLILAAYVAAVFFTPNSYGAIDDSKEAVQRDYGSKYKVTSPLKFSNETRLYMKEDLIIYVSFRNGKVCNVLYSAKGEVKFAADRIMQLLEQNTPGRKWRLVNRRETNYGSRFSYETEDGSVEAKATANSLSISGKAFAQHKE